jgi:hypothetical protein
MASKGYEMDQVATRKASDSLATGIFTIVFTKTDGPVTLMPGQRLVLIALCRPIVEDATAAPATSKEIERELCVAGGHVRAHLRALFDLFGCETRAQLAATVLASGILAPDEFSAPTAGSMADELAKLAALRDSGDLTPEEFEAQKAKLLTS